MTDQTPNGEKKQALPAPTKKKTSAYDQPFSVMKDADQIEASTARPEPARRPAPQPSAASEWKTASTSDFEKSAPAKESAPKKAPNKGGQKKKSSASTTFCGCSRAAVPLKPASSGLIF